MATDFADAPPPGPPTGIPETPPRVPRGHPWIAWAVIAAAGVGLFVLRLFFQTPADVKEFDTFEIQSRALVGAANLAGNGQALYEQAGDYNRGPAGQRLRFVVLAGELRGPDEALKQLHDLKGPMSKGEVKGTDKEAEETADTLDRLYRDYLYGDGLPAFAASTAGLLGTPQGPLLAVSAHYHGDLSAPNVSEEQRQQLRRRLGWFGDLALHPRDGPDAAGRTAVIAPALRLVYAEFGVLIFALGGGAVGFVLLILFFALWRQMRSRFHTGSPFGGVYAETFALWMVLFIGLSLGSAFVPASWPGELLSGAAALGSLAALGWPVLRGVPWRQVRRDVGWTAGDRPALEPLCGVVCYVALLPVVLLMLLALVLFLQFGQKLTGHDVFSPDTPTHPIVDKVLHSGWQGWIQAVFLASVVAPIMEETMFRGVLYRHMREATGRLGRWRSVILSALVVSFVFAALHPQGLLAVPVLMALAFGFTAAREWRGSLIPSMTVHALHNGALMVMLILAAS